MVKRFNSVFTEADILALRRPHLRPRRPSPRPRPQTSYRSQI